MCYMNDKSILQESEHAEEQFNKPRLRLVILDDLLTMYPTTTGGGGEDVGEDMERTWDRQHRWATAGNYVCLPHI